MFNNKKIIALFFHYVYLTSNHQQLNKDIAQVTRMVSNVLNMDYYVYILTLFRL